MGTHDLYQKKTDISVGFWLEIVYAKNFVRSVEIGTSTNSNIQNMACILCTAYYTIVILKNNNRYKKGEKWLILTDFWKHG